MMPKSTLKQSSLSKALVHATVQLTAPSVISTNAIPTRLHSYATTDEISFGRKIRCNLSSLTMAFSKYSHLNKQKRRRDVTTQTSIHINEQQPNHCDNNVKEDMTATLSSSSPKDYLFPLQHFPYSRSLSCSSPKHAHLKTTRLVDIWQGFHTDDLPSSTSSLFDPIYFEERVRRTAPQWKACAKVVTSLLTFTRTKKERYEWMQLVGHPGTFKEGTHDGYVLKALCEHERYCCELLQNDVLSKFVPKYNGTISDDEGNSFIEMEDLLASFHEPCIMDCKIGVRTYLEEELDKSERDPKPRTDLYHKMIAIDRLAPTEQEHEDEKVLKSRYMIWRENMSSSQDLGFRIEAIKKSRGLMSKEFQRIKDRDDVKKQLTEFIAESPTRANEYLERLLDLRSACVRSNFFQTHELIGSSLLFVHDGKKTSISMIDFGKTRPLPKDVSITHNQPWIRGSHEDGYLLGLDNLISLFQDIIYDLQI
ncbi:unnamed protein product [Adineta ricciae]|uniref:Kinase n=1 Tax=Adineta ricciae TaxID=249248 RepID=A0A814S1U5_ADIRI|nr:unnamed protein product [Adineta ricciae]CAF1142074.1 unnamed protein product [Adineta ricciae]